MNIRTVLCPVDFSEVSPSGVRTAARLAQKCSAELVLVHVVAVPRYGSADQLPTSDLATFLGEHRERARARLEEMAAAEDGVEPPTRCLVEDGVGASEIVEIARREAADLIVIPKHSLRGLERLILGSVAEKVVRLAPCPVLTIHPDAERAAVSPEKVIFATDFSDYSDAALPHALALAELYEAELLMVHVATVFEADPANPEWTFPELPAEYLEAAAERDARELDQRYRDAKRHGLRVESRMLSGFDPAMRIVELAETEGCGMIVMATHGRTGLKRALIGSTAERVVRYAVCPVVTVRPSRSGSE